jgi:hypothetical protein
MAAPVIWFGSCSLLSLMVGSGAQVALAFWSWSFVSQE